MNKRHFLKTVQPHYQHAVDGEKKFELRFNDRNYKVGDHLVLMEYDCVKEDLTQKLSEFIVTHIFADAQYGLTNGFVALSIEPLNTTRSYIMEQIKIKELIELGINPDFVLGS